jgi:CRP/FNR family transcriptional regulator, cyclic AMP receptor protein
MKNSNRPITKTVNHGNDQLTKPADRKASAAVEVFNPAPNHLLALIAQQPFFKGLNEHLIQLVADSTMEMQFKPGDLIYRQGDPANRFYLILEGKVLIESEVKERGVIPIRTLGPGDDLGWAWLFPPHRMHFNARAIESTRAIFFYGTRLLEKCETNHELGYQLMKRVAEAVVHNLNATQQRLMACTEVEYSARTEQTGI